MFDVALDPKAAALVATMEGVAGVLRAPRRAHGPGIIAIAGAKAYRADDDYYYFGFASAEAVREANERILARIEVIKMEARDKPHYLVVTNLAGQSIRWLTLSIGKFDCARNEIDMRDGEKVSGPTYGFDTEEDVEAAALRVRLCPEFKPGMGLFHVSRSNGKNLNVRPLEEESNGRRPRRQ